MRSSVFVDDPKPSSSVISSTVGVGSRTVIVTLCSPRIAASALDASAVHGCPSVAIGSRPARTASPDCRERAGRPRRNRAAASSTTTTPVAAAARARSRATPAGTENDVTSPGRRPSCRRARRGRRTETSSRSCPASALVAVIEVIDVVIVEVDGLLDQAQAERARGRNRDRPARRRPSR